MCLGIVGRVVEFTAEAPEVAHVDVAGVTRPIHVGLLRDEGLAEGEWVLIHAGFAMERIDETTAQRQVDALREYSGGSERGEEVT